HGDPLAREGALRAPDRQLAAMERAGDEKRPRAGPGTLDQVLIGSRASRRDDGDVHGGDDLLEKLQIVSAPGPVAIDRCQENLPGAAARPLPAPVHGVSVPGAPACLRADLPAAARAGGVHGQDDALAAEGAPELV